MSITKEEYQKMVDELLGEQKKYDMLCFLADRTLMPRVKKWVNAYPILRRYGTAEDLMQNLHILLMKKTISNFVLRAGTDKPVNDNPEGFKRWLFVVARNYSNSLMTKIPPALNKEQLIPDDVIEEFAFAAEEDAQARQEILSKAFNTVVESDSRAYKILTWLAYCCVVVGENMPTHSSSEIIDNRFKNMSLFEMYNFLKNASVNIPWIAFTPEQDERITHALCQQHDGRLFGEIQYGEFYMKKGGKSSISDWINRMNDIVKRS